MRHLKSGRKFSRVTSHREAMRKNLVVALFRHERIVTTPEKAKEYRGYAEKWITLAREKNLHNIRQAVSALQDQEIVKKLFDVLGPRFKSRPGGYTRVLKLTRRRVGDNAAQAIWELVERTPKEEPAAETKGKGAKKKTTEKAAAKA